MPAYFLISIPRRQQADRKNRIGSIYLHPNFVYMTRGMQCGQIVDMGSMAAESMPEAKIGHTLLVHHFVESNEKQQCIAVDEDFYYYVVTCKSHNGQNNQTYAVYDGQRIIPHPDYIFLESKQPALSSMTPDAYLENQLTKTKSGLLTFKEWTVDREALRAEMEEIKKRIDSLTKSRMTPQIASAIEKMEGEMNRISKLLTKQRFELYTLVAASTLFLDEVEQHYESRPNSGDNIYMLNIACETKMEFNNKEYIVAKTQHFGAPFEWIQGKLNIKSEPLLS